MKDVRIELDAEIARSKELLARQPQSNSHHSRSDIDNKHGAAIRFYEDFSNLLVLSIKFEQRGGVEDDVLYTCMYTHVATIKGDETDAWEQVEKSKSSLLYSSSPCMRSVLELTPYSNNIFSPRLHRSVR